jgi:hypothetical protein
MPRIVTVCLQSTCLRSSSCGDMEMLRKVAYLFLKFLMVMLGTLNVVSHNAAVLQERNHDVRRGLTAVLHSRSTCFRLLNVSLVLGYAIKTHFKLFYTRLKIFGRLTGFFSRFPTFELNAVPLKWIALKTIIITVTNL